MFDGFDCIGLERVLLRCGFCSLPLLTQPLAAAELVATRVTEAAPMPVPPDNAPAVSLDAAYAAKVFLLPRRIVRWFLFCRRVFGSKFASRVFAT